jgi:formate dehydrogenase major subunit
MFAEISPELAQKAGIRSLEWLTIVTPRSLISARALVTTRMRPLRVNGRTIEQVGLPYHWGWKGLTTGDVTNDLLPISQEPNVRIMSTKALVCNLLPGRRADHKAALKQLQKLLKETA